MRLPLFTLIAACTFAGAAAAASDISIPRHELPAAVVQQALAHAAEHPQRDRFAVRVPLGLELAHGRWDQLDPQTSRWRLRLHSPGALSMAAHLSQVTLPAGAQLRVYGPGDGQSFGPFTQTDLTPLGFWTPVIDGDELVLEVQSPTSAAKDLRLEVAEGYHGYKSLDKASTGVPGPGGSGSCNHDAVCQSATWSDEIRSVAMITFATSDGMGECTGQLLNTVRQDRTVLYKLFLTARHCGIGHAGSPPDSVSFYFNYQNASCDVAQPAGAGPAASTASADFVTGGASLIADDVQSDFALIKVNGTLPAHVFYAGWDATVHAPATTGAALHHPTEDDLKVSLYDSIDQASVNIGERCAVDAWEVHWSSGTTEPGSSGGGLWEDGTTHYLIGVLSGGNASCSTPNAHDYFGRLEQAWTASPNPGGQLKNWLDPDGTNIAKVPGLDPDTNANPSPITSGPTRPEGTLSTCSGFPMGGGGGGSPGTLLLGMLGGLLLRARRAL